MTEEDMEAELEAWQDFAADHYEMVEQLPLELHRNFRLLRELDDGCTCALCLSLWPRLIVTAQSALLLTKMREYLAYRLGPKRHIGGKKTEENEAATNTGANGEDGGEEAAGDNLQSTAIADIPVPPKPVVAEAVNGPEDLGLPVPDGQGGVLLPPADEPEEPVEERRSFPDTPGAPRASATVPEGSIPTAGADANAGAEASTPDHPALSRGSPPAYIDVLPEIGKLSREIVRNAEEKLAIAVGAYNTVRSRLSDRL
jgi:hypothetical protein